MQTRWLVRRDPVAWRSRQSIALPGVPGLSMPRVAAGAGRANSRAKSRADFMGDVLLPTGSLGFIELLRGRLSRSHAERKRSVPSQTPARIRTERSSFRQHRSRPITRIARPTGAGFAGQT